MTPRQKLLMVVVYLLLFAGVYLLYGQIWIGRSGRPTEFAIVLGLAAAIGIFKILRKPNGQIRR